ncbi:adenylate/guanylate cyclase domain-containing response regulator [Bosea sp. BIWAKO-01]|uniref:adenylate/guanylate cyclase domain-containing protein n=1 Tax=Bosea sp. BIWAKO-01 TaxID=506668 RepID=UPI000852F16E|nr:adenylate/guanylate cyclase domain-containing response regulator [Bosea sp. BIWAKO-01]GAU86278.1 adenylate cyclase [Bosea sp. BIWAKO-01]
MSTPARILVVDDEADVELLISQRFRRQVRAGEFAFVFARDGEQALRLLQDGGAAIDLMLLDINMPVMDGLTLLARLRELHAPVRAIIVSAYGDMPNIRTAMNRGAFDFVTKPIDMVDLELTIRRTLDDVARLREIEQRRAAAERARSNLARYFSPNLVEMLAERDEPFGPVRRQNVAVLFADIVGFTALSERMRPEDVMLLLRQSHERMTTRIFACGGTVEKYIGDAILAIFGVPTTTDRDAGQALKCADGMMAALCDWNRERSAAGEAVLGMGIGVNYGPAVVGDVGSARNMSFTVIGDTVNLASRLQTLTRSSQTSLLVADAVVQAAKGQCDDELAEVLRGLKDGGDKAVRGRNEAVRVWQGIAREFALGPGQEVSVGDLL